MFTGYDMPPEVVIELAGHPNIVGIKESGGDAAKIRQIVEGTRHIKRSATVTEIFAAVTPRMLKSPQANTSSKDAELVTIGAPSGAMKGKAGTGAVTDVGTGTITDHVGMGAPARPAAQVYRAAESKHLSSSSIQMVGNLKTRQKEVGFQVLAGAAQRLLPSLEAGAVGAVLAFASPAPTACYEIFAAWKEGDRELAGIKQERIARASTRVGAELGVPALKYAADLNGYYGGPPRLPFLPLTAELKTEVEQLMSDIRN